MAGLTKRQRQVLDFVQSSHCVNGTPPTLREIAAHFGFSSTRAAADHLDALKRKGLLESERGKFRSLRVTTPLAKLRNRVVDIPLLGSIPAGSPQDREQEAEGCVSVDIETLGFKKPPRYAFALIVKGDSMIGRHILDGDIIVLEYREPRDGDVVCALIDGETTLKTFVRRNGRTYLKAENPKYPDLIPSEHLVADGVMVTLIRRPSG